MPSEFDKNRSLRAKGNKSPISISIDDERREKIRTFVQRKLFDTTSAVVIHAIDKLFEENHGGIPIREITKSLSLIRETNLDHVALNIKEFIEKTIFSGRKVRVGFARKIRVPRGFILKYKHIVPVAATYPIFHYPCTVASWALIEGRIFAFPIEKDRKCDFDRIAKLLKLDDVTKMISDLDTSLDDVSKRYIDPALVKEKFSNRTLSLTDVYQNWVGDQPNIDYCQFVSVPVPIVENVYDHRTPPEYGVINIDTSEEAPLLTEETEPLLALASEIMAVTLKFSNH